MRVSIEAPSVNGVQMIHITTDFCGSGFLYMNVKELCVNNEWTTELNKGFEGDTISHEHANRVLNSWVLAGYPRGEF